MCASYTVTSRQVSRGAGTLEPLLVVATVAVATLLGEGALRMTGHFRPNTYPPPRLRQGLLLEAWEPYGYRLVPSTRATYLVSHNHPRAITVVSNRDGFRASRELEEPDVRPRVVFLGDSFVFGDGVQEPERFTNVLETLKPSWRIDNLGMVGYGPDLMLRALEVIGLKLKPAIVVLCIYTDDFRRVRPEYAGMGFLIPRFKLEAGHLVSVPYPTPNLWNRLDLSVAVNRVLWNYTDREWDLNRAILDRFEQLADQQPFQKAILFLPGKGDTPADQKRRSWLRHYANSRATPFLDLSDAIHKMGKQAFIEGNPHLNPAGNLLVAQELDRFLSECHLPSL
jgi:hypothetical protein